MSPNQVAELVPKHKSDDSHIADLLSVDVADAEPILRPLLKWIQDINWPVAGPLLRVLPRFHVGLTPIIEEILGPDELDEIWKYWIINSLLDEWPTESLVRLMPDVERIAACPTPGEHREEVDEVAAEFLERVAATRPGLLSGG